MATSLKPFCSNRFIISAINPRLTPSGLTMMNDFSELMILAQVCDLLQGLAKELRRVGRSHIICYITD